jgi:hypothetical protein
MRYQLLLQYLVVLGSPAQYLVVLTVPRVGEPLCGTNWRVGRHTDPPSALVASIAWESGDGQVTSLNL